MSYNLSELGLYTDEMSFELISNAVLQTKLMEYSTLRSGLKAGTTAINIVDLVNTPAEGETPEKDWVQDRSCGWDAAGNLNFSQVNIVMSEKQTKQALCPSDLRDYYLSEKLSASAHAEEVPFAEVISNLFVEKIKNWNETFLASEMIADVVAGGTSTSQSAASTPDTILADIYALVDAVDPAYSSREDLGVVLSPTMFNMLRRTLVAQNLYHIMPTDSNDELSIPGTGYKAIKGTFATANVNTMVAGPLKDIVIGVGLEDDFDMLKIFYSADNDEVRVMGAWRLGLALVNASAWAHNGL